MLSNPLRALCSRNYRLYFCGQALSLIGTWMTYTAMLWHIYHLTNSAFSVGLFGFVSQVPMFVIGLVAGMIVDRMDRRRVFILTQVLAMLQVFALALLALTGNVNELSLLAFGAFQGAVAAFVWPARGALLIDFVENRDQLGNALALNSSMFNLARFIGTALAGFVITAFGPAACYLIDGLSYGAIIMALLSMRLRPFVRRPTHPSPLSDIRDGLLYVWNHPLILLVLQLVTIISFFNSSYSVLMPQLADEVFGGDARTLGFLMSASGCGALVAALYLSMRSSTHGFGRLIVAGGMLLGGTLIALPRVGILPIGLVCMFCLGVGSVFFFVSSNAMIQLLVSDEKRGRVTALFIMTGTGTAPIASLMMGWVSQRVGGANALALTGALCLLTILRFHRERPRIRAAMEQARHPANSSHLENAVTSGI